MRWPLCGMNSGRRCSPWENVRSAGGQRGKSDVDFSEHLEYGLSGGLLVEDRDVDTGGFWLMLSCSLYSLRLY